MTSSFLCLAQPHSALGLLPAFPQCCIRHLQCVAHVGAIGSVVAQVSLLVSPALLEMTKAKMEEAEQQAGRSRAKPRARCKAAANYYANLCYSDQLKPRSLLTPHQPHTLWRELSPGRRQDRGSCQQFKQILKFVLFPTQVRPKFLHSRILSVHMCSCIAFTRESGARSPTQCQVRLEFGLV